MRLPVRPALLVLLVVSAAGAVSGRRRAAARRGERQLWVEAGAAPDLR